MALDEATLKAQLNMSEDEGDEIDATVLPRLLAAAVAHVESILGFALNDEVELPNGIPSDLEQAVLMIAAHWYGEREAVLIGVSAQVVPFGASQILSEHRRYTFG